MIKLKMGERFATLRNREIASLERRLFLRQGLSMGALSLLAGCNVTDEAGVENALRKISSWNDTVQAKLFDPKRLVKEYPASAIVRPFPFNAFYEEDGIPAVSAADFSLELAGLIRERKPWSLAELYALPQVTQTTRHICVEGWSAIGQWTGAPLRHFLERVGADTSARYVGFKCADDYYTSIDMATALHPQTLMAFRQDGDILPATNGFPLKIRVPNKLGFKHPKHVRAIFVTNEYPGGYWEDQGYNWFAGL